MLCLLWPLSRFGTQKVNRRLLSLDFGRILLDLERVDSKLVGLPLPCSIGDSSSSSGCSSTPGPSTSATHSYASTLPPFGLSTKLVSSGQSKDNHCVLLGGNPPIHPIVEVGEEKEEGL